ncbi:hypothetical protein BS47DRAFT_229403 [Hydnum rufescens UP504]|uniref:Uncharacterized protein n=1 Tax=Hydnum rufescens UP504 TaxID=1448309 RepID=A0A9P6B778_9AGAM|nr:hypothetical protein BS47DRAFT_229403 [Hydnum rufescens UP504]
MSPPRPIPALHGPPSLPYARCPSGAEGVMISEQSSLPRMIWGLEEQTLPAPKTPHLQSSIHDIRVSTVASENNSSNAYTPASTMVNTPASTFVTTPSTNTSTPASTTDAQHKPVSDHGDFNRIARHSGVGSKGGSEHLGSPLELATPGGYTEYHYVESPQWQEFVPPPPVEPAADLENLQRAASVYASSVLIDDPVQQSHTQFLSRPALTLRNHQPRNSYPPGTSIPPYIQRRLPAMSVPQYQARPKFRDLTQITGLISNADMTSLTAPELWSASLRQFWNDTFAQLGAPATAFAATLNPLPPFHPPGIPIPSAAQRSGPTPSSRRSSGESDANSTDKHEPYAGALDNPRSVPIARLRRKLTTVAEEKDIEGHSRQRESAIEEKEIHRTPVLSLEAETQTAFGGVIEEGLRVRLPQRSDTGLAGSNNHPATHVIISKATSDTRRRNAGRRPGMTSSSVSNTSSKDPTKENRRSFSSSVNNSGPKQTKRQQRSITAH